jgi:large conductance mechanosensitive channel
MSGFKNFLLRGNLIDIAVGIVIGVAFNNVVQALVKDFITPLISFFGGLPDFGSLRAGPFRYGDFVNVFLNFLIVAAVLYFFIVKPYAEFKKRFEPPPEPKYKCPYCFSEIALEATRCAHCTSELKPAMATSEP